MKKTAIAILASLTIIGCGVKSQTTNNKVTIMTQETITPEPEKPEDPILTGLKTKADLQVEPYTSWFASAEKEYNTNVASMTILRSVPQNYEITIFMGTWCGDSKVQVPHFYKILTEINFDLAKVKLITMDRSKTTIEKFEDSLNITNVPTFIFYRNGKELQRIVESPIESLESDMVKIITGQPYKHTYQD